MSPTGVCEKIRVVKNFCRLEGVKSWGSNSCLPQILLQKISKNSKLPKPHGLLQPYRFLPSPSGLRPSLFTQVLSVFSKCIYPIPYGIKTTMATKFVAMTNFGLLLCLFFCRRRLPTSIIFRIVFISISAELMFLVDKATALNEEEDGGDEGGDVDEGRGECYCSCDVEQRAGEYEHGPYKEFVKKMVHKCTKILSKINSSGWAKVGRGVKPWA